MSTTLGMMIDDNYTPDTPVSTAKLYTKPGGIRLPYIKPPYTEGVDTFIIRRDPVTGDIYETGPSANELPWQPNPNGGLRYQLCPDGVNVFPNCPDHAPPGPDHVQPQTDPGPVSYTGGSADFDETTGRYRNPNDPRNAAIDTQTRGAQGSTSYKPLLIAGAVVAGLYFFSGK